MNARRPSNRSRREEVSFSRRDIPEILCETKAVSLVTKRFVKFVGIFSGKPCIQSDAPDSSLAKSFSAVAISARPIPYRRIVLNITRARIRPEGSVLSYPASEL